MENSKRPFLYTLIPCGDQNQDYLFKRIWGSPTEEHGPNVWAMHMDIEDSTPESVLIFVRGTTAAEEILDKTVNAQAYFVKQIQPFLSEED